MKDADKQIIELLGIIRGKSFGGTMPSVTNLLQGDGSGNAADSGVAASNVALKNVDLSQFASTTSAQLRGVLSDETGSGAAVFATSPTLVTPVLGTPSSGALTNCTSIPAAQLTGTVAIANGGTGAATAPAGTVFGGPGSGSAAAPTFLSGVSRIVQTVTTAASQSTISLTVPSGYTNAIVTFQGRSDAAVQSSDLKVQFNSDTGANYDHLAFYGFNSQTSFGTVTGATYYKAGFIPGASVTAGFSWTGKIIIPNYSGTTYYKEAQATMTTCETSVIYLANYHGIWHNTAALTSITLTPGSGNFVNGSVATLTME